MSQRSDQVAEELRKIISLILLRELNDPRIGFLTVTRIEMTDDLRYAKVYYSVLGDERQKTETEEALADNLKYIKRLAVQRINLKYAMDIRFELDPSIDHSFKIDNILNKIKKKEQ